MIVVPSQRSRIAACSKKLRGMVTLIPVGKKHTVNGRGALHTIKPPELLITQGYEGTFCCLLRVPEGQGGFNRVLHSNCQSLPHILLSIYFHSSQQTMNGH
jgi:hypothetical protein